MTITKVTSMEQVLKLVPIELKLREKEKSDVPVKDMLTFVQYQLQANPYFGVWILEEDDALVGYIALFANVVGGVRDLHIWRIWHDPHRPDAMRVLEDVIRSAVDAVRAKKVKIEVARGEKVYQRKWGFKPVSTILERRV